MTNNFLDIRKNVHTAQSLKWCLGMDVLIPENDAYYRPIIGKLVSVSVKSCKVDNGISLGPFINYKYSLPVYPILKTADQMTDEELLDVFKVNKNFIRLSCCENLSKRNYSKESEWYKTRMDHLTFYEGIKLIEKGYGAIPDKDSPTGYVDLFGMPCVTPEMVEKGVEL